jgi:two-component system phosphate regulon sensor histidine kinase PhoR
MIQSISQKIALLNQTTLNSLVDINTIKIMEHFTETGIKILGADYGFAWWNDSDDAEYKLVYKSPDIPYEPNPPRERGGNFIAKKTRSPYFMEHVLKENYEKGYDVSPYMKSYVIIPIAYKDHIYGNLVLCFKSLHIFSSEDRELAAYLGNTTAQSITINRLISKEQEARLIATKQEAHFKALLENSHEVVMLVDKKGYIQYISSSVENIFGIAVKDALGHRAREFLFNTSDAKVSDYLNKTIEDPHKVHVEEYYFKQKDGTVMCFEATAYNMLENLNVNGVVVNIHNITEKKKAETLKETERLLKEEMMKTEFIANATHEIRTPLAIIRGNADLALMHNKELPAFAAKAFKAIGKEIEHLSKMIADLTLLTSQTASLKDGVILSKVNIAVTIRDVVKRCKTLTKNKRIVIKIKNNPDVYLQGDDVYLEKLFLNLIRNAVNYGKENGWIEIDSVIEKKQVKISVSDNGIGICKEDLDYIFNRFYRVDKSHHPDGNSTGLGLAIVKWIVTAHGGSVDVESRIGKGTKFTISLPTLKLD